MENKPTLIIGAGGHCHSVIDCLLRLLPAESFGIVGLPDEKGKVMYGVPVIGSDEDIPALFRTGWKQAVIAIGSIGTPVKRHAMAAQLKAAGFFLPPVIDPSAILAGDCQIDPGAFIGKAVIVNAGAHIGECAIVNTGAIIEHDCRIGPFAHIAPGAVLCGAVDVGENTHVGAGSTVRQCIVIGHDSLIGAGSIVVKDIPSGVCAYGNPIKVRENRP